MDKNRERERAEYSRLTNAVIDMPDTVSIADMRALLEASNDETYWKEVAYVALRRLEALEAKTEGMASG